MPDFWSFFVDYENKNRQLATLQSSSTSLAPFRNRWCGSDGLIVVAIVVISELGSLHCVGIVDTELCRLHKQDYALLQCSALLCHVVRMPYADRCKQRPDQYTGHLSNASEVSPGHFEVKLLL